MQKHTQQKDLIWVGVLIAIMVFIVYPTTNVVFIKATEQHPLLMGFIKFAILATMGELLAIRVGKQRWLKPTGIGYRAAVWGLIGIFIVYAFNIFQAGARSLLDVGLLPSVGGGIWAVVLTAFYTSMLMNLIFGPVLMLFHKIMDALIEAGQGTWGKMRCVSLGEIVSAVDWHGYIGFVLLKTIPFFWIPAHTIVFLLPGNYRVVAAAFLSLALGVLLSFVAKK